jgi:hypothetical protein
MVLVVMVVVLAVPRKQILPYITIIISRVLYHIYHRHITVIVSQILYHGYYITDIISLV